MTPNQYRLAARVRGVAQRVAAPLLLGTLLLWPLLTEVVSPVAVVALAFVGLGAFIASTALGMFPLEVELEPHAVESPVRGRWRALNSPATKVPSHGTNGYGQTYAIDLVREPRPEPEGLGFDPPERFPTFGADVLAVADATVVSVRESLRDHRCRARMPALAFVYVEGFVRELFGVRFMFGNHVVLELGDGVYAAYAHLKRGSVTVRPGDRVRTGDVIARAGNSGNSTEPHLHFQLMDHPRPLYAAGLPFALPAGIPPNDEHLETPARVAAGVA